MICETVPTAEERNSALLAGAKRRLRFQTLVPWGSVSVDLDALRNSAGGDGIKKAVTVQSARDNAVETQDLRKQTAFSLQRFVERNRDLANDDRFCDTYNYRVSSFYKNLGEYEKEREYLLKIQDTEHPFYKEKIAENLLCTEDTSAQGLLTLESLSTEESALYRAAYWREKGSHDKAREILDEHYRASGPSQGVNDCLAVDCIVRTGDIHGAIHFLRESFCRCRMSDETALMISALYYRESGKNRSLLKKSERWARTAFNINNASVYALSMLVRLCIEREPRYVRNACDKFLSLPSSKQGGFYQRATLIKAKTFFIQKRYGDCIDVLQELVTDAEYCAAAWHNIAMCNKCARKYERALKNMEKAVAKARSDERNGMRIRLNYANMLGELGRNEEAVAFYESLGTPRLPTTRMEYIENLSQYVKCLCAIGSAEKALRLLCDILDASDSAEVKICAAIDIIGLCHREDAMKGGEAGRAARFLQEFALSSERCGQPCLNDAVFALLEREERVPNDLLARFVSGLGRDPYSTATYGLYLFRVKGDMERGAEYYEKAMRLSRDGVLMDVLRFKCRIEIASAYLARGMKKEAARELEGVAKKCPPSLSWYARKARNMLARLSPDGGADA